MRQEPNNSIDLLLRQLGQQEDVALSGLDEQHLDADELSSYVANALPSKTRARYMQHLADCSTCRKMVAQLSAAEGVVAVQQPATVAGPSGLKSFLASLFSPMVLRYAVPALGVIVITVVGIVMLRQQQHESEGTTNSIAQVTNTDQNKSVSESARASATPPSAQNPAQPKQVPRAGVMADAPAEAPAAAKAASTEEADREQERQPEAEKKTAPATDQNIAAREVQPLSKAEAKAGEEPKKAKQQTDEDVAAAPPPVTVPGNKGPEPQTAKKGEATGAGNVASTTSVAGAGPSRQEASRARRDETTGSFAYLPTRTVAGREFAKRGDVWIDVAYNSSQETKTIRRGTEEYRALIANEPAIQTIAEDLKSEFVVVWKGRAYRIR
ncbi:MAG TPA: zf-HC2 domain-containing protein [Pyrinomonadaceae bacterium]|nr:zf-HC2 domain-containing protein [Pyrinomonadaceae bacterium]